MARVPNNGSEESRQSLSSTPDGATEESRYIEGSITLQAGDSASTGGAVVVLNALPRSVRHEGNYLLLDGEWKFAIDADDEGLAAEWFRGHDYRSTIMWPSSIESALDSAAKRLLETGHLHSELDLEPAPGAEDLGGQNESADGYEPLLDRLVAWYERDFTVPSEWMHDPQRLLLLTFGGCGFETRVWLNGAPLTTVEGEHVHLGEYTSFSYEIPQAWLEPTNRLTVRTADSLDPEIPRGKQESRVYKRGGIWYQTISGPIRSAWIEPVMSNRLRSRLGVISSIEDKLVEFILTTHVRTPGDYRLLLSVAPRNPTTGEASAQTDRMEVVLPLKSGERRQRVVMHLPGARLWSPSEPNLYRLHAELIDPDGSVSVVDATFGIRKIEARGRWVYLNNEKLYLDGILYQPANSTLEEMVRHLRAIKALGCNLTRVHIAGLDPRIYDLADQMGMLLWVEVPSPHASSQRSREYHWAELQRTLAVISSHPSVVILSLYNEDWGVQDIGSNAQVRQYIARTFAYLRASQPQLLIVDNDGWRHVSTEGRLESHLLTAHLYTTDVEKWGTLLDQLFIDDNSRIQVTEDWGFDLTVGDPYYYRGQVPLVVSEWGGFGWEGYGGPTEGLEKAEKIKAFKHELMKRPIAGDVYTQATSIEDEVNGLINPQTGELLVQNGVLASPRPVSYGDRRHPEDMPHS